MVNIKRIVERQREFFHQDKTKSLKFRMEALCCLEKSIRHHQEDIYRALKKDLNKSEFVERFPELSLFYRLFSPLNSEMICIFPYFCPYAESAREIREIFS